MPAPIPRSRSRLSRVYHRLSFALGLGVTVWVVMGYIGTRMRSARIKLVRDRQRADRSVSVVFTYFEKIISGD